MGLIVICMRYQMSSRFCGSVNHFQVIPSSLLLHRSLVGLGGLLLDEVGGGVGDLVDDGLGQLLHPLGQLKLGHTSGIRVDQI